MIALPGRPDLLREKSYVNGAWVDASQRIVVTNPADGTPLGSVPDLLGRAITGIAAF